MSKKRIRKKKEKKNQNKKIPRKEIVKIIDSFPKKIRDIKEEKPFNDSFDSSNFIERGNINLFSPEFAPQISRGSGLEQTTGSAPVKREEKEIKYDVPSASGDYKIFESDDEFKLGTEDRNPFSMSDADQKQEKSDVRKYRHN